jgi:3-keto-disaccharide hydrolase
MRMRPLSLRRGLLVAPLTVAALCAVVNPAPAATLTDGDGTGNWSVVFAGFGSVTATGSGSRLALRLRPTAASQADETHAALVASNATYTTARLKTRVTLNGQLRTGSDPNPWETGWLVTRYTDDDHFYYLALKTNGWELGKRDPAHPGGQRFLMTGATPRAAVGDSQTAQLSAKGSTLTVRINGSTVATFTDGQRPYQSGRVGMYTEDADVTFDRISVATS